jgi:hypothetical protein
MMGMGSDMMGYDDAWRWTGWMVIDWVDGDGLGAWRWTRYMAMGSVDDDGLDGLGGDEDSMKQ